MPIRYRQRLPSFFELPELLMRRTAMMTTGFVLIFLGIQLNLVQSYTLTPRFSNFLSENASANMAPQAIPNTPYNSPYYQASFGTSDPRIAPAFAPAAPPKTISPPTWLCWPVLFLGMVLFLHGFSMRRNF